jgi:hypothetical protein
MELEAVITAACKFEYFISNNYRSYLHTYEICNYNFDVPPLCSLTHLVLTKLSLQLVGFGGEFGGVRALPTVAFFTWMALLGKILTMDSLWKL